MGLPSVLVIDDEPGLRDVLAFGLPNRGFEVTCAPDGETALRLAQEKSFDLAVCDIMMPGVDGLTVLEGLKKLSPKIEVIMATGFAKLETAVESMKKGAYDYVTKPYTVNNLSIILEKALEHSRLKSKVDHLEEVNRLKSEFIATMSHELRTPITCTIGFSSLLLEGVYGKLEPRQKEAVERSLQSSENLLKLVSSILDLSKLSANRMGLSEEVFELRELGTEVLATLEPLAQKKGLRLVLEAPEPLWVQTDRTKLKEILINLLGNSIKFTKQGGATLRLRPLPDPAQITIQVSDTGIGIKPEHMSLLFEEFRQVDSSSTRQHEGTGLGLCISKKLVELMKGTIRVESQFGSGTTFHISLPVRTSQAAQSLVPNPGILDRAAHESAKKTVLCIDDEPMVLKLLADSLEGSECQFVGALSGQEGLALARQLHPDIITLDIMMPHMDGWSVLQAVKEDPALRAIPVYILSIVDNKPLAFSLGVQDYLLKPFSRTQLLEKLHVAGRKRSRHALVVDDDRSVLAEVSQALKEEGYDVETVDSGEEAVKRLAQLQPDLLLLDLVMPKVSGFDVLVSMDSRPMQDLVTIVMTEEELSADQTSFLERRVRDVVKKKSATISDIMAKVKKSQFSPGKAA